MFALPKAALPLFRSVAGACVLPTGQANSLTLMCGAIHHGHRANHQSAPPRRRAGSRPSLQLSPRLLAAPLVRMTHGPRPPQISSCRRWVPEGSVAVLAGDDTVDEHRGARILYGKGFTPRATASKWGFFIR